MVIKEDGALPGVDLNLAAKIREAPHVRLNVVEKDNSNKFSNVGLFDDVGCFVELPGSLGDDDQVVSKGVALGLLVELSEEIVDVECKEGWA